MFINILINVIVFSPIASPRHFLQPLPNRLQKAPASMGKSSRSFGTPLSNSTAALANKSVTTSKKVQTRQSSSKKVVRARKLVQQHRTPSRPVTSPKTPSLYDNSYTYTVTFLPGSMGLQMEPAQGLQGCKVNAFADKGPGNPGQARLSNQIRPGDVVLEINDDDVSHMSYNDIIDRLKQLSQMPRKMLFRSTPPTHVIAEETGVASSDDTPLRSFNLTSAGALTPIISPPSDKAKESVSSVLFMDPNSVANSTPTTANVPSSPAYISPVQLQQRPTSKSNNNDKNVVLDVKDTSIDRSSIISPSKIKNLSQEDIELGFGGFNLLLKRNNNSDSNNNQQTNNPSKKPLANVFRTVYNSVMVGRVGSFDSGHTKNPNNKDLPFIDNDTGVVPDKKMEASFHKKSQMVQDLNNVSMVVDDIYFDIDQESPRNTPTSDKVRT